MRDRSASRGDGRRRLRHGRPDRVWRRCGGAQGCGTGMGLRVVDQSAGRSGRRARRLRVRSLQHRSARRDRAHRRRARVRASRPGGARAWRLPLADDLPVRRRGRRGGGGDDPAPAGRARATRAPLGRAGPRRAADAGAGGRRGGGRSRLSGSAGPRRRREPRARAARRPGAPARLRGGAAARRRRPTSRSTRSVPRMRERRSRMPEHAGIVTGASSGIGLAIAELLAADGVGLCLVASPDDREQLEEIAVRLGRGRASPATSASPRRPSVRSR